MSATSTTTSNNQTQGSNTGNTSGTTNPWSVQVPYLTSAFAGAQNALNNTSQYTPSQLQMYTNEMNAGQNMSVPNSSAAAGGALSNIGTYGALSGVGGLNSYNPASTNNTSNIINSANQYVAGQNIPAQVAQDMVGANQEAAQVTNPGIDAAAAGSGNINSSRDAIEHGMVASNLGEQAANLGAGLQANAYNTGIGTAESAAQSNNSNSLASLLGLTQAGSSLGNAGTAANAGSVSDTTGLYNMANTAATGQNTDPYQSLLSAMGVFGGTGYGSSTTGTASGTNTGTSNTQGTSTPSTMSIIGALLGSGGSLLGSNPGALGGGSGLLGLLGSDVRLKTDIEQIGQLNDGLNLYRYRYKTDAPGTKRVGLMAHEVEQKYPEAVHTINGFKAVDYDMVVALTA